MIHWVVVGQEETHCEETHCEESRSSVEKYFALKNNHIIVPFPHFSVLIKCEEWLFHGYQGHYFLSHLHNDSR